MLRASSSENPTFFGANFLTKYFTSNWECNENECKLVKSQNLYSDFDFERILKLIFQRCIQFGSEGGYKNGHIGIFSKNLSKKMGGRSIFGPGDPVFHVLFHFCVVRKKILEISREGQCTPHLHPPYPRHPHTPLHRPFHPPRGKKKLHLAYFGGRNKLHLLSKPTVGCK